MHGVLHREFFGQGWMKLEKNERTPYIMKNTKHFNDVSAASGQGQEQQHSHTWPGAGQGWGLQVLSASVCARWVLGALGNTAGGVPRGTGVRAPLRP